MASSNGISDLAFKKLLLQIATQLESGEVERLFWIAKEDYKTPEKDAKSNAMVLFQNLLESKMIHAENPTHLKRLLVLIDRSDLARMGPDCRGANAVEPEVCRFRLLLYQISYDLTDEQVEELRFYAGLRTDQETSNAISTFAQLNMKWGDNQFHFAKMLIEIFNSISRSDLADRIQQYLSNNEDVEKDLAESLRNRATLGSEPSQSSRATESSSSQGLTSMEIEITCTICLDKLTDPICTPCGHSFCRECLKEYVESTPNPTCPNCREDLKDSEIAQEAPHAFKNLVDKLKETEAEKKRKRRPETPGIMQVLVKSLANKTVTLKVKPTDTILTVKEKFKQREGFSVREQRFLFGGKELQNDCTLNDYNIKHGCTLHFVLRLLGGTQNKLL